MRARPRAGAAAAAAFLLVVRAALVCDACGGGGETVHRWATPQQEAEDERRDAEILRAVVSSMDAWSRRATTRASSRRRERAAGVCYPEVGCFSDSGVFGYLDMLPSPPDEVGTRFLVWGSGGGIGEGAPGGGEPLLDVPFANYSRVLTLGLPFDPLLPTKIIVHGFGSSCSHVWVYEMRSALTAVEKCNVLCVDWEAGATVPNYVRAAANTRLVGKQLALLLRALADRTKPTLDPARVHIIGFSLGAHVAGFAGAEVRGLRRITGLDPAGPLFEGQDPRARLDATDANFVDVIHSNGESLVLGGLGSWQPMGHVDFYPNGGRMQKGCSNIFVGAVSDILWSASDVEGRSLCNHRRAYKFFTDSVSPRCQFPAFPCASYDDFLAGACFPCANERACGNMGYYADRSSGRGVLFLVTRDEEPFCAHQYFVRVESAAAAASDGRDASAAGASSYGSLDVTLAGDAGLNETFPLTTKRDEQLRPGQSLQRLVVPHPALATPARATLLYTAYAGWWSSGLPTWPVRKLSLVDSFGKSMSVCHNDELLLRSGEPMTLQLFPGECSTPPPAANASTTPAPQPSDAPADAASSTEGDRDPLQKGEGAVEDGEEGGGVSEDALTALLAGAPVLRPWPAPSSEGESAGNSLEDGRAFRHALPTPATAAASTSAPLVAASTPSPVAAESPRPVREPVLTPRNASLGTRLVAAEGAEEGPGASARRDVRVAGRFASEDDTRLWIPAADLNPPPLGGPPAWRHWTLARAAASATGPSSSETSSRSGPTVQLLPQRLASLLSQAERAALRGNTDDAGEVPNGPRQRRPKVFGAQSSSSAASSSASSAPPSPGPASSPPSPPPPPALLLDARGSDPRPLVALAHRDDDRFIPLSFPPDSPSAKRHAAIVTVTPERLRSGFRSVKIPRPDAEDARADDERRPVYRPAAAPPRPSDATRVR